MVGLDLYRNFPGTTRKSVDFPAPRQDDGRGYVDQVRKSRSTTLDGFPAGPRHRSRKADPGLVLHLITGLVEAIAGKPLDDIFGFSTKPSPAYGRLVGLNIPGNLFADVRSGFNTAIHENGLTATAPRLPPNSANRSENARYLSARSMGVTPEAAGRVQPATPRSVLRFDEFAALMTDVPSLQAALDAGMADGIPLGLVESTSALLGALMAAARVGDTSAMRLIGEDFGALASALYEATAGTTTQRSGGHVLRRKDAAPRGRVIGIEVSGEFVPVADVTTEDGRVVRRRRRDAVKFTKIT